MSKTTLTPTFRAAFYRGAEDVVLRDIQFDKVQPAERIIRVDACGICGTDINAILRGATDYTPVGPRSCRAGGRR